MMTEMRFPITLRAAVAWVVFSIAVMLAVVFAGTAYGFFLVALFMLATGLWDTSEARHRSLLEFVWREGSPGRSPKHWSLQSSFLLLAHAVIWLGFTVAVFAFANFRLADLWS